MRSSHTLGCVVVTIVVSTLHFITNRSKFHQLSSDAYFFLHEESQLAVEEESVPALVPNSPHSMLSFTNNSTRYSAEQHHNTSSSCHFQDGNGNYELVNGSLSWNWIHNTSLSKGTGKDCMISNQIDALLHDKYNLSKPLAILALGDSLDRNNVDKWICGPDGDATKVGFTILPVLTKNLTTHKTLLNKGKERQKASTICTNHNVTFAFFKIFGMYHDCKNGGALASEDSRRFRTTAGRAERLLDFEIRSRLSNDTNYVVMVGSALWDLSSGCNNRIGVAEEYQRLYQKGILDLHAVIRKLFPSAPIYWKTSPAISVEYDKEAIKHFLGRNRANQAVLNDILRKTVAKHHLGEVVDWWAQSNQRPENERGIARDGRHYTSDPSLAFYNMFLNAAFDHNPELIN